MVYQKSSNRGFSRGVGRGIGRAVGREIGRSISNSSQATTHAVLTKQRTFIVETNLPTLDAVVDALCRSLPELEEKHFTRDSSGLFTNYKSGSRVVISGKKLLIEMLKISKISQSKYQFEIGYDAKIGAVPIVLGVIGLLFGVIPGLLIFLIAFWLKSASSEEILPALERFESIAVDMAVPQATLVAIATTQAGEATARLRNLDTLLADGLISKPEYDRKREEIIASI